MLCLLCLLSLDQRTKTCCKCVDLRLIASSKDKAYWWNSQLDYFLLQIRLRNTTQLRERLAQSGDNIPLPGEFDTMVSTPSKARTWQDHIGVFPNNLILDQNKHSHREGDHDPCDSNSARTPDCGYV